MTEIKTLKEARVLNIQLPVELRLHNGLRREQVLHKGYMQPQAGRKRERERASNKPIFLKILM